jgi:hypothetical protein
LDYPSELPFIRYGVLSSGAVLYDFERREPLEVHALSTVDILRAMELAAPQEPVVHLMSVGASVVRTGSIELMPRVGMGVYVPMYERICTVEDDLAAWAQAHEGEFDSAWRVRFDDALHRDGIFFEYTRCPIAEYCRELGVSQVTPVLCELDHHMVRLIHARLIRERTLAEGGDGCDYWIVGDKTTDSR